MKRILLIFFIPAVSLFLTTCTSYNDLNTATVTIDTGIGSAKAAAPGDVTAISVTVTGSGMRSITESILVATGIATFQVPSGPARVFSVTATAGNFTYLGTATQDVAGNADVNISISMVKQSAIANIDVSDFQTNSPVGSFITGYTVTVTESDTTNSFSTTVSKGTGILNIEVPAGSQDISVSANIDSATNTSAVTAAGGSTSATFSIGETQNLTVAVGVTETKVVIPDYQNSRLIQINNINEWATDGYGWKLITDTDIGFPTGYFYPYDVDFDSLGRIYIANYVATSMEGVIIRIDDLDATTYTALGSGGGSPISSVAVDRNRQLIYYTINTMSLLYQMDYNGNLTDTSSWGTFEYPRGIAVDSDGIVYIVGGSDAQHIYKFNPSTGITELDHDNTVYTYLAYPWDVTVKGTNVYVSNMNAADGFLILEVDQNLGLLNNYYNTAANLLAPNNGEFFGPHRFLAILNRRFYLTDENEFDPSEAERVTSFNDTFSDWVTFVPGDAGVVDTFQFFSVC